MNIQSIILNILKERIYWILNTTCIFTNKTKELMYRVLNKNVFYQLYSNYIKIKYTSKISGQL